MGAASRYRVTRLIARGGMAEVFEATAPGFAGAERNVALKRMLPGRESDEAFVAAFMEEVRIASRLDHPNIVAVLDFGVLDGVPFQILELVDGVDLKNLERIAEAQHVSMTPEVALAITAEVAGALDHAHSARDDTGAPMRIIHRDVSPQNVLVSWAGEVKLADFGIALALRRTSDPTRTGYTKGKVAYMAPEQMRGDPLDARTDIFALGCVLYRIMSGRSPIDTEDLRAAVRQGGAPVLEDHHPQDVLRIVRRATAQDRAQRYASGAEMAEACLAALSRRTGAGARALVEGYMRRVKEGGGAGERFDGPAEAKARGKLDDLFDLELVAGEAEPGSMRRFASVAVRRSPDTTEKEPETRVTDPAAPPAKRSAETLLARPPRRPSLPKPVIEHRDGPKRVSPLLGVAILGVLAAAMAAVVVVLASVRPVADPVLPEAPPPAPPAPSIAVTAQPTATVAAARAPEPVVETATAVVIGNEPRSPRHGGRARKASQLAKRPPVERPQPPAAEEPDARTVRARLDAIADKLQQLGGRLPPGEVSRLEDRYLDLRASLRASADAVRLARLAAATRSLEQDLAAAEATPPAPRR